MLGVTAATVVTSWREQSSLRETEVRALQGIANEVALNLERLTWRRDYYRQVEAEIAALRKEKGADAALADLKSFRGLNPVILRPSSFQIGLQTQALGRFDYALAEEIADVYALQDWVLGGVNKWMDYIVQHSEGMVLPPVQVEMIMGDWAGMCSELIEAYKTLQVKLPAPLTTGPE